MPKKGYKQTEEHRRKTIKTLKGRHISPKTEFKKGYVPWNKNKKGCTNSGSFKRGIIHSKKSKKKMGEAKKELFKNHPERNPSWMGGKSFEPYGLKFNKELREQIRERDNHTCQECSFTQKQLNRRLSIHHIDFNKKNNNPENLLSLCVSCHNQTNFNRQNWINYFQEKIK